MFLNYKILQNINKYNNLINYGGKMSYKVPDSITAKVQQIAVSENKKKKYSDLYNKLDQVNNKFSTNVNNENLPDSITLDRIDFKKPSNEEIKLNSENLLADYKNSGIKNIEDNYKLKYDELNSNKSEAINQTENTKNNLKQYYENAKTNAEYEASKRGLNRSSIIVNQLDAFSNAEINDYKELDFLLKYPVVIFVLSSYPQKCLSPLHQHRLPSHHLLPPALPVMILMLAYQCASLLPKILHMIHNPQNQFPEFQ